MMNKKTFGIAIQMLTSNFGIALDQKNKEDKAHVKLIFDMLELKGFTDQDFQKAVSGIILNESSLFGKMPTVAMFLKYAGKQELTIEQRAGREVTRIISYAKGYISGKVIFDSSTTNAVARDYGIGHINNHLTNKWLDYKKGEALIRKELLDRWITFYHDNKRSTLPIRIDDFDHLDMVGDKVKCKQFLEVGKKVIEQSQPTANQNKINLLISKIGKK